MRNISISSLFVLILSMLLPVAHVFGKTQAVPPTSHEKATESKATESKETESKATENKEEKNSTIKNKATKDKGKEKESTETEKTEGIEGSTTAATESTPMEIEMTEPRGSDEWKIQKIEALEKSFIEMNEKVNAILVLNCAICQQLGIDLEDEGEEGEEGDKEDEEPLKLPEGMYT